MKDTNKVIVALIKNTEGKYLFMRPSNYKDFGNMQDAWYPPSGHVKEGETLKEAVEREVKEELGTELLELSVIGDWEQDVPGEIAFWWNVKVDEDKIKTSEEIAEYKYFSTDEIKDLKLWPATRKFFEKFIW